MFVLKALTILIAGILSILTVRYMMQEMQAVKVRAREPQRPQRQVRLRQDPRTGIYFPEN